MALGAAFGWLVVGIWLATLVGPDLRLPSKEVGWVSLMLETGVRGNYPQIPH